MLSERELQRLGDELVTREVRCCLSQLVSRFEGDEEWQEDLSAAVEDSLRTEVELRTAELEAGAEPEDEHERGIYAFVHCNSEDCDEDDLESAQDDWVESRRDQREPLEYWAVSRWLGRKLSERGEVVLSDWYGLTIWGRQTSGQSIGIDYVIRQIVLEIHKESEAS